MKRDLSKVGRAISIIGLAIAVFGLVQHFLKFENFMTQTLIFGGLIINFIGIVVSANYRQKQTPS
jgi:FtsH-binding integral membrane protein